MGTKYFLHKENGSVYKTFPVEINKEIKTAIQRYNWFKKDWTGHQLNRHCLRENIENLNNVVEITKEQMLLIIKKFD